MTEEVFEIIDCPNCKGSGKVPTRGTVPRDYELPAAPTCGMCKGLKRVTRYRFPLIDQPGGLS